MGLIRLIGDGPPAPATVQVAIQDALAALLPRHTPAFRIVGQPAESAPNLACRPSEPVLHIYLNDAPALGADCHARLGVIGPGMPQVEVPYAPDFAPEPERAVGAEIKTALPAIDGVYQWPGKGADSSLEHQAQAAFGQWVALGVALAQARYAAAGRRHLADALLASQRKLAKEIHGGAVQELVAGTFLLGLIPDGAGEPVLTQIQKALSELRALCQRLNPPALEDFGLVAALRTGIRSYQHMSTRHARAGGAAGEDAEADEVEFPVEFPPQLPELAPMPARTLYWVFDQLLATLITDAPPATITKIGLAEEAEGVVLHVAWVAAGNGELPSELPSLFGEMVAAVDGRMAYHAVVGVSSLQVWVPLPA